MVEQRRAATKTYKFGKKRRRPCAFCADKIEIDYKNVDMLRGFVSMRGKIVPKRQSSVCPKHQRRLSMAIKRSRTIGLLPYVVD
jgi:small subunit ribosomal protein S18